MTSKFSIENRELLQRISSGEAVVGIDFGNLIVRELAAFRLAAMDSKPVALQPELAKVIYHFRDWNEGFPVERFKADYVISWMLANYPPAQPTPVVPEEVTDEDCPALVKYDVTEVDEAWARGFNACRAAMLQAQSEDDDGEPTDDERIMAIEGIHNCERCGDEGWIVGEMGITSCACGQAGTLINEGTIQAGNSPVITGAEQRIADAVELLQKAAPAMLADNSGPDGPLAGRLKSPVIPDGSAYMLRRWLAFGRGMQNAGSQLPHNLIAETESMLAAAPKPQNSPQNIPEIIPGWIPVSERMPETDGNYWGWWSESKRQGPVWFIKSELQAQFQSHEITHWMPLPAAPQEVKGE
ncbi:DUF551 domain-containing protein [Klebsiella variicola]|uniref:DUF551 domain-containing protein n=1 Tax=Klebsiella variicola TaxID=244366 RepID=UPI00240376F8|nr:DUF551 domain-containing protein [Klebsiella variicola]MDI0467069.1 DUF551 domain-containing protein [Klebsiella variicola]